MERIRKLVLNKYQQLLSSKPFVVLLIVLLPAGMGQAAEAPQTI
jgi:hypothetical protein